MRISHPNLSLLIPCSLRGSRKLSSSNFSASGKARPNRAPIPCRWVTNVFSWSKSTKRFSIFFRETRGEKRWIDRDGLAKGKEDGSLQVSVACQWDGVRGFWRQVFRLHTQCWQLSLAESELPMCVCVCVGKLNRINGSESDGLLKQPITGWSKVEWEKEESSPFSSLLFEFVTSEICRFLAKNLLSGCDWCSSFHYFFLLFYRYTNCWFVCLVLSFHHLISLEGFKAISGKIADLFRLSWIVISSSANFSSLMSHRWLLMM